MAAMVSLNETGEMAITPGGAEPLQGVEGRFDGNPATTVAAGCCGEVGRERRTPVDLSFRAVSDFVFRRSVAPTINEDRSTASAAARPARPYRLVPGCRLAAGCHCSPVQSRWLPVQTTTRPVFISKRMVGLFPLRQCRVMARHTRFDPSQLKAHLASPLDRSRMATSPISVRTSVSP